MALGPPKTTDSIARLDERRRISRELHETTSQLVVVLQLQLSHLRRTGTSESQALFAQIEQVVRDIHESIRLIDMGLNEEDKATDSLRERIAGQFFSLGADPEDS